MMRMTNPKLTMLKQTRQSLTPELTPEHGVRWFAREPYYLPLGDEVDVFADCHERGLPVMLKGPTGCGKTRFVEHMAWRLGRPLVTIACHDDLSASDLTGRFLIRGERDGVGRRAARPSPRAPARSAISTRSSRRGRTRSSSSIRSPTTGASCRSRRPASSSRPRRGSSSSISYNPGYQHAIKDLKPSTRQRFVATRVRLPAAGSARRRSSRTRAASPDDGATRSSSSAQRVRRPAGPGAGRRAGHPAARRRPRG